MIHEAVKKAALLIACCASVLLASCSAISEPGPSDGGAGLLAAEGVVVDSDTDSLTIRDESGGLLRFWLGGAPVDPPGAELAAGNEVAVYYTGTPGGSEAPGDALVSRIVVTRVRTMEDKIRSLVANMSLEEKCGQLFFIRCPSGDAAAVAKRLQPGGYVLFASDFEGRTVREVQEAITGYQSAVSIPMLIAADEEGGTVTRISKFSQFRSAPFWSPQDLYEEGGFELIRSDTEEKAKLFKNLGLNVNLAPVCDVSTDPGDFIYDRSFGRGAEMTSQYVRTVVEEMKRFKVGAVLKHFPGYGNNRDTHTGSSYDERSLATFESSDFLPFEAGIEAGAGGVMVSHNIVACMDPDAPASLSLKVHQILRERLGFEGVIMTDDLSMKAITDYTGQEEAVVKAVLAGNDMILCSSYESQVPALLAAVKDGRIDGEQIDRAVGRILKWKVELGLLSLK